MSNELLLILSLIVTYSMLLLWFKFFGKTGLICWNVFATICANIEVNLVIKAFGMQQTLGNILFASTFLVTDIIGEIYGKKDANQAVKMGTVTTISFTLLLQSWLMYSNFYQIQFAESFRNVFSPTLRALVSGLIVYVIVQFLDVYLYHKIWSITIKKWGTTKDLLWVRNVIATLLSQFINVVLFTLLAFYGKYQASMLVNIILSSYVVFLVTSIASLPTLYIARKISPLLK